MQAFDKFLVLLLAGMIALNAWVRYDTFHAAEKRLNAPTVVKEICYDGYKFIKAEYGTPKQVLDKKGKPIGCSIALKQQIVTFE